MDLHFVTKSRTVSICDACELDSSSANRWFPMFSMVGKGMQKCNLCVAIFGCSVFSVASCSTGEFSESDIGALQTIVKAKDEPPSSTERDENKIDDGGASELARQCNLVFARLRIGISEFQVQNKHGNGICAEIHTTETYRHIHEQWVWGDGSNRYVYFDNGVLTAIQR